MCFLLTIGAATDGWRLAGSVEVELGDWVEVVQPPASLAASFPAGDAVRAVTSRGCSCELLEKPVAAADHGGPAAAVVLTADCRRALAGLARRHGALRLLVGSPGPGPHSRRLGLRMSLGDFASPRARIPSEVLVDVVGSAGP